MSDDTVGAAPSEVEVSSDYVRSRHCVVLRGEFDAVWEDLGYHLLQNGHRLAPGARRRLQDGLACVALHSASKPRDEMLAWTMNLIDPTDAEPPLNVFVTGDSQAGTIVGRAFTRDVKVGARSRFFAQVSRPRLPVRQSTIEAEGTDVLALVEAYYRQSEQLPARVFRLGGETFAMLVAHPDYDAAWFETVSADEVARVAEREELGPLERLRFRLRCGCDLKLIHRMLRGATGGDLDALYGDQDELRVECPRCASVFRVPRADMEVFLAEGEPPREGEPPG